MITKIHIGRAILVLASAFCAFASYAHDGHKHRDQAKAEGQQANPSNGYNPPAPHTLGGPFSMIDHTGRTVTEGTYRGSWMLLFFGYTGCREACPTGLVSMGQALEALGADAERLQPLFVDFSMEEPDVEGLAQFVSNFHPKLVGLTGTRAQTFHIVKQFKVRREYSMTNYSSKETGPRINHTTYFYLVDPEGKTRAYFYHDLASAQMAEAIQRHLHP
jgi:cytochrome oxidase Cu insertion factor (SCO1/SenC/PrrC family)